MSKVALVFPGQGAQSVGMGKDLYDNFPSAKAIIDQMAQWVDPQLSDIMFNGPEETLKRTLYTQPAILAVSLAALTVLKEQTNITPTLACGHSLGEYGALYAAGVIDLETTAKLIHKRAALMESAPSGAMSAVLGLGEEGVKAVVDEIQTQGKGIVTVANFNTPEQSVISGEPAAVEAAAILAKEKGAGKVIPLPVGGAFHSPLMQPAADEFAGFVTTFPFQNAAFPVITNIDAQETSQASEFQSKLAQQISGSVQWSQTMRLMQAQGIDTYIEIGPGKVLAGMLKKFDRSARILNVFDSASLAQTVSSLNEEKVLVS